MTFSVRGCLFFLIQSFSSIIVELCGPDVKYEVKEESWIISNQAESCIVTFYVTL